MDHAERGTVEKTLDELINQDRELEESVIDNIYQSMQEFDGNGSEETLILAGVVSGILSTIRTYSNDSSGIEEDDIDEILNIVRRREREFLDAEAVGSEAASTT